MLYYVWKTEWRRDIPVTGEIRNTEIKEIFFFQPHRWTLFGFPSGSTAFGLWQILTSHIPTFEAPQLVAVLGVPQT